jgi:hypothetical protein
MSCCSSCAKGDVCESEKTAPSTSSTGHPLVKPSAFNVASSPRPTGSRNLRAVVVDPLLGERNGWT